MGLNLERFRKNRPSEWVEWLSDDPLPPKQQQIAPVQPMQPQVHRPAAYSPVTRSATQIPVQHVTNTPSRPMAPPGMAQPIQPIAPPAPKPVQPVVAAPSVRPVRSVQPLQPMAQTAPAPQRPVSMARPVRPLQSFTSTAMVQSIQQSPVVQAMTPSAPAAVSIQISMPKFKLPELPYRKIGYWAGGVAAVSGLVFGGWTLYQHYGKKNHVAVKGASTTHTSPTFDTLAPQNKPELGQGSDASSTAYDGQRDLYTFKDNLMGFPLVVSQQPLPDNLKKDPNQLQKVAESMGTNVTSTDTAYGKVYVATSEKGDAQRAVFAYKDVMVLVQSYKIFDGETWKYYVETLRQ